MNIIKQKLQKLPLVAEFFIVILIAFGYFIFHSFNWIFEIFEEDAIVLFTNFDLYSLIALELAALLLVGIFLYSRNYKFSDFNFAFSLENSTYGLILFSANYILYYLLYMAVATVFTELFNNDLTIYASPFKINASLPAIIAISIINPVFEETIVVGYIVKSLEKTLAPAIIIGMSVIIRLSYHVYQGPIILVSIMPMGLLFAWLYWKTQRLWPLVLAHAVLDFTSFYFYYVVA
jgi:membrane protease YdiL (CAAX protease family)